MVIENKKKTEKHQIRETSADHIPVRNIQRLRFAKIIHNERHERGFCFRNKKKFYRDFLFYHFDFNSTVRCYNETICNLEFNFNFNNDKTIIISIYRVFNETFQYTVKNTVCAYPREYHQCVFSRVKYRK